MADVSNGILICHSAYIILRTFKSNDKISFSNPSFIFALMEANTRIKMDTKYKAAAAFNDSCTTCFTIFRDLFSSKTK